MTPRFFILTPEASGETGPKTVYNRSKAKVEVETYHFIIEGWQGDHLISALPCYLVTEQLAAALVSEGLTGFEMGDFLLERSPQFRSNFSSLPDLKWLKIVGHVKRDDFGISPDNDLIVTERALSVIRRFPLNNCYVDDADTPLSFEQRKRRIYLDTFKKLGLPPPKKLKP